MVEGLKLTGSKFQQFIFFFYISYVIAGTIAIFYAYNTMVD